MIKNLFRNPSFLFLLAGNLYCIWYYQNNPRSFATVVWIYWFQSVTIGLFNFIDLLTIKNFDGGGLKLNDQEVTTSNKGCTAFFFLVHYGFFHVGYAVFLLVDFGVKTINGTVLLLGVGTFFLESILNFMRQKQLERTLTVNLGTLFFLPYLRIVPMHLMILLPKFFGWQPSLLFLGLKMVADILSFMLYQHIWSNNKLINKQE